MLRQIPQLCLSISSSPPPPHQAAQSEHTERQQHLKREKNGAHLALRKNDLPLSVSLGRCYGPCLVLRKPANDADGKVAIGHVRKICIGGKIRIANENETEGFVIFFCSAGPASLKRRGEDRGSALARLFGRRRRCLQSRSLETVFAALGENGGVDAFRQRTGE